MTQTLDDLDKHLLKLLQTNSRATFSELSYKLNTAEATIRFRVKRLVDRGIISKFTIIIDPNKTGQKVIGAILLKIEPTNLEKACKTIATYPETMYLFQSTGEYDIVSVIVTQDLEHLNRIVKQTKTIKGIKDIRVSITTQFLKFEPNLSQNL
ncbi:MAG: Lrp/AsnC family transcriptional regulator [Nitrososphaerota archaeon]|jgi:Lrp/AsnC family transcriptional regulator for asnA, asnC and gidA|nr:Lrp/AsnC family transcriptional regulator [Nitrososphaerota archaeon]